MHLKCFIVVIKLNWHDTCLPCAGDTRLIPAASDIKSRDIREILILAKYDRKRGDNRVLWLALRRNWDKGDTKSLACKFRD